MEDQFQITLPSNSSFKYYPDNTGIAYTSHLHSTLNLPGQWEVALMDIQFPIRRQNNQKEVMLGVHQREWETAQVGINGKQTNIASMVSNSTNLSTVLGQTSENPTPESYSLFLINKAKDEGHQNLACDTKSEDQLTTMYV